MSINSESERSINTLFKKIQEIKSELNLKTDRLSWYIADDGLRFTEVICQEYYDCKISAGLVTGAPVDKIYIQSEKNGIIINRILLSFDETVAIMMLFILKD